MKQKAYITGAGKFLPGPPVGNDEVEEYLGMVHGKPSRMKEKMLKQNGILFRHYAMNKQQNSLYSVTQMAALAIEDCLQQTGIAKNDLPLIKFCLTAMNDFVISC